MQFHCIKMRYSIEPRDRVYVKGYGFMSFARSMSNKYGKKLVDAATKSATDAIKTASKRAIQKMQQQQVTWQVIKSLIKQQVFLRNLLRNYLLLMKMQN